MEPGQDDILLKPGLKLFFNRELSLIEFNKRVLAEAESPEHPLLERLKFISIFSSNQDEFFMIRVAGLKNQKQAGVVELSTDGMTPQEQLKEIRKRLIPLYEKQTKILLEDIIPALEKEGVFFHNYRDLSDEEKEELNKFFCQSVLPVLTPLSLDPAHPFPRLINRSLNIVFAINDKHKKFDERKIAFIQLPSFLPRFVRINRNSGYHFVLIEQIIKAKAQVLFPGLEIITAHTFRVTRDADIEIAEDEAEDLLDEIAEQIKHRKWGTAAVRLEVSGRMPHYLVELLRQSLELEEDDVYILNRPLNLPDFMQLVKLDIRHLKDPPFQTRILPELQGVNKNIFSAISEKDLLVHHPFDSFTNSVLRFVNEAADDPDVLAIKITLYRTGTNSPVVEALKRAAEKGKEVTAFVELKARFDEESNIHWARELEQVGVHVIYGILGLKTHCKVLLVVRREHNILKTYVHLATGNYNQITARLYTDIGLFTANSEIASEVIHLFNYLTGYSYYKEWKHLLVAPINLRQSIISLINREAELHTPDNPGFIFAKMNSIAHDEVTKALYRASIKGVKINLIVRGVCCLRPGLEGISENIEVRSILGRFLEHSRIFMFKNAGNPEFYLSSADWMTRNLHRRVEVAFPVYDENIKKELHDILNIYWRDNTKSWRLLPDGNYEKITPKNGAAPFSAQEFLLKRIEKARKKIPQKILHFFKSQ
ncbi:MAG: polyphosphate kinase 1 [Candidatus Kapabacteria bacterium]|nr:polyphosphate kinase 1 [Candidatus Kapabacteria bacterium]